MHSPGLLEPHPGQVQRIDKGSNSANRLIFGDIIFNTGREQQRLASRRPFQMPQKNNREPGRGCFASLGGCFHTASFSSIVARSTVRTYSPGS